MGICVGIIFFSIGRFLHSAPVLSCESKNGGFGRNDNEMDTYSPEISKASPFIIRYNTICY